MISVLKYVSTEYLYSICKNIYFQHIQKPEGYRKTRPLSAMNFKSINIKLIMRLFSMESALKSFVSSKKCSP